MYIWVENHTIENYMNDFPMYHAIYGKYYMYKILKRKETGSNVMCRKVTPNEMQVKSILRLRVGCADEWHGGL